MKITEKKLRAMGVEELIGRIVAFPYQFLDAKPGNKQKLFEENERLQSELFRRARLFSEGKHYCMVCGVVDNCADHAERHN